MKKLFRKNTEYCCELMQEYLDEKKVGIYYNPIIRGYYICLRGIKNGKHIIYNCPWCGNKLPKSLLDEYLEILENEFGILTSPYTGMHYETGKEDIEKSIPEEFKTNEWWKKRAL